MQRGPENKDEIRQQNTGSESNREPQIDTPTGLFRRAAWAARKPQIVVRNADGSGCLSFFGTAKRSQ
jgi:hypothetical protein